MRLADFFRILSLTSKPPVLEKAAAKPWPDTTIWPSEQAGVQKGQAGIG